MVKCGALRFLRSIVLISLLGSLTHSVSGQPPVKNYEAIESKGVLLQSSKEDIYSKTTAIDETTHSSGRLTRKQKKYHPNGKKFKTLVVEKLILNPNKRPFSTSTYADHPFMRDDAYGASLTTQQEDTTIIGQQKRRNRNSENSRIRRQAASDSNTSEGEDELKFIASDGSKKISQSVTTGKASQQAVQTAEARKSHTQQSDAKEHDEYTYNADGSVKSRTTISSSSNKQELLHISKTKSVIPMSESLDPESVMGKDENGDSRSLLSYSKLAPLGTMPEMEAMEYATTSREGRVQPSSESDSNEGNSRERSLNGGSYLPSKENKNGRSLGGGRTKSPPKANKSNTRDRSLSKGLALPEIQKSPSRGTGGKSGGGGGDQEASPIGYGSSSSKLSLPTPMQGAPPHKTMKLNMNRSGTQMSMPVMNTFPLLPPLFYQNFGPPPGMIHNQGYQPPPILMQMYNRYPRYY